MPLRLCDLQYLATHAGLSSIVPTPIKRDLPWPLDRSRDIAQQKWSAAAAEAAGVKNTGVPTDEDAVDHLRDIFQASHNFSVPQQTHKVHNYDNPQLQDQEHAISVRFTNPKPLLLSFSVCVM